MANTNDGKPARSELPPEIHAELVETLFGTVGSFISGILGGLLVPLISWARTDDPVYLGCGGVLLAFTGFRLAVYRAHSRAAPESRLKEASRWELLYAIGAIGFMLTVGVTAAILLLRTQEHLTTLYGVVITLGCVSALAGRNAGRPAIVHGQVLGLCMPLALTLLLTFSGWYWGLSAILVLVLTSVKSTTRFLNGMLVSALLNGREARMQKAQFSTALDSMSHGLCMGARDGSITVVNQRLVESFGLAIDPDTELSASRLAELIADSGSLTDTGKAAFVDSWNEQISRRVASVFSWTIGEAIYDFRYEPEEQGGFVVVTSDVTAARLASQKIEHMAHFDVLTGLPNRSQFHSELTARLDHALGADEQYAVLSIDLDQFKEVNDSRGHPTGDELLCMVAQRLRHSLRAADLVARFGGDEFVALLHLSAGCEDPAAVARRVIDDISQSYVLDGSIINIGASIGLAYAPGDAVSADELLRCADMALYSAKASGRGACHPFRADMETALLRKRQVGDILRYAIEHDGLELHYQPVVDTRTGRIVVCEALVRLRDRTEGWIPPSEFIPVAEDNGMIVSLGEWVLNQACRDAASWPDDIRVAVNFSPKQFVLGGDIASQIGRAIAVAGLPAHRLEVEITESTLMEAKDAMQQLQEISRSGVRVSLDDFGTGYSSLSYLRQFPVDKIKIDRSFAIDLRSQASEAVIRSVSVLANLLKVDLVIEGIEQKAQVDVLTSWDIHLIQGYYFSRPRPIADLLPLLDKPFERRTALRIA